MKRLIGLLLMVFAVQFAFAQNSDARTKAKKQQDSIMWAKRFQQTEVEVQKKRKIQFKNVKFSQTDSVDIIALNLLNIYRKHHNRQPLTVDMSCKESACNLTRSMSDSIKTLNPMFWFKHTVNCNEIFTARPLYASTYIDDTSNINLSGFVSKVYGKTLRELTGMEIAIVNAICSWNASPKHKELMLDNTFKTAYFSFCYVVDRPGELKKGSVKTDPLLLSALNCTFDDNFVRFSYAAIVQFEE